MRRRWLFGIGSLIGVGLVTLVACWLPPRSPINRDAFERIEIGMTVAQVEAAIGLPPGDYGTRWIRVPVLSADAEDEFWRLAHEKKYISWSSDEGEILIRVSPEGVVTNKMFYKLVGSPRETPWERLLRWIGGMPEPEPVIIR
jgi:hypothetical protein